ncbi:MAG: FecR domain-containing protein [Cyclobacteriaceae bacterium]|nr:FecR domain-containing protein [Cyclobacteriaceae bacterium]
MNNRDYIEKWLAGTLADHERDQFVKTDAFQSLQRMDRALKNFQPAPLDIHASFEKVKARTSRKARVLAIDWRVVYRIAAVLLMGSIIFYFLKDYFSLDQNVQYATAAGETRQVTLPDKSVMTLNAMSSVSFSADRWSRERKIVLDGEAYFDVEKGKSFQVITPRGQVTVLGTRFTVKDRPGFYEVVCYEGRVEVKGSGETVQLARQDYYRESDKSITQAVFATEALPAWLNRESSFQSVPLFEVVHELERQYGIVVKLEHVDTLQRYTGKFPHKDLTTALQAISLPLNLTYKITDSEIRLFHGE